MYRSLLFISFSLFTCYAPALAQGKAESVEQIFRKFHEYEHFQGAVLVAEAGEVIYRDAFGLANREWNILNDTDTRFDIASISKQFTAMLVLQLAEEGRIHLDSTISAYYPRYRKDIGRQVTIHHLLTHQSGIPNYTSLPFVWSDSLNQRYSKEELVKRFCSRNLEFRPGSRYQYNNTGYFLLSIIIEQVTQKDYETVLTERILQPLGMLSTGVDHREKILHKRAYGYERSGQQYQNVEAMFMQNLQGAGNLYATIDDLFIWDRALYDNRLVSRKTLQKMQTPYTKEGASWIPPYTNYYGYGVGLAKVDLQRSRTTDMVFHSGHIKGFSCFMARFVDDEHTIIILSNTGNVSTARMNDIAQQVKNILYGLPYQLPERSLAAALLEVLDASGIEAAVEHYYQLRETYPYEFKNARQDLDQLGMALLDRQQFADAVEIFRLNVKTDPDWLTYQRLASACMLNGNAAEAAIYYRQSISLNPRRSEQEKQAHAEARQALRKIQ